MTGCLERPDRVLPGMRRCACLILAGLFFSAPWSLAHAASKPISKKDRLSLAGLGTLSGQFRDYDFYRWYEGLEAPPDAYANGVAGLFNFRSLRFGGHWRVAASFYVAEDLFGLNNSHAARTDVTLFGTSNIQSLGQAYLSYASRTWALSAGDKMIETPWMGPSDSRLIPATYQGLFGTWRPIRGLTFMALRVFRWKSRTSSNFSATNLYNRAGVAGIYGGEGTPAVGLTRNTGTLALGSQWDQGSVNSSFWYYHFYGFAEMAYGSGQVTVPFARGSHLLAGIQLMREWSSGHTLLEAPVSSTVYGAEVGVRSGATQITLGYDKIPQSTGVFHEGGIVSPYSAGYATDPLYTTSMTAGLVEKAPGEAAKLALTQFFGNTFRLILSEAGYWTAPLFPDTHETDLDVTWYGAQTLRGLSIRNRLGIVTGLDGAFGGPNLGTFLYERIMIQYRF